MANEFIARNGIISLDNSQITGSLNVSDGITGNLTGTATTASYVLNAVSSSRASSAANADTASYVLQAVSASFATTASYLSGGVPSDFPYTGSAIISGSLGVTGSISLGFSSTQAAFAATWTAGGAMITARAGLGGAGTATAALAFGGFGVPTRVSCTEAYNGTSWSVGGALSTTRYRVAGAGTSTSALVFGGCTTSIIGSTEAYNGTSWSAGGALIQA
jgi:hypothetical protein